MHSLKSRWLVILAPHKRPEVRTNLITAPRTDVDCALQIKDGWGWCKWDVESWSECRMTDSVGELLEDRCVLVLAIIHGVC